MKESFVQQLRFHCQGLAHAPRNGNRSRSDANPYFKRDRRTREVFLEFGMHRLYLINALGFQAAWWACVASVGQGMEIAALVFCMALACAHLFYVEHPWQEVKLASGVLVMGIAIDTLLQYFSVIHFYGWSLGALSPFWLWALWVMFAMTLNVSLAFLKVRPLLVSALVGLIFGPLSYYAGTKLGAASFEISVIHVSVLAFTWMLALPAMVLMAQKIANTK